MGVSCLDTLLSYSSECWRPRCLTALFDFFSAGFGAVLIFDDEPVRGEVKGWNVKFYKINKNKRHMDGIAISSFWNQLTGWLKLNKPWVLEPPAVSGRKK